MIFTHTRESIWMTEKMYCTYMKHLSEEEEEKNILFISKGGFVIQLCVTCLKFKWHMSTFIITNRLISVTNSMVNSNKFNLLAIQFICSKIAYSNVKCRMRVLRSNYFACWIIDGFFSLFLLKTIDWRENIVYLVDKLCFNLKMICKIECIRHEVAHTSQLEM